MNTVFPTVQSEEITPENLVVAYKEIKGDEVS